MNLPNQLTVSRFFLTIVFMIVLSIEFPYHTTVAMTLFIIGAISDFVDGYYARKYQLVTNFGKLMDPLVDKVLTGAAFIAFTGLDLMPWWMVVVIVSRELAVTGLRLLAASKNQVLAAENLGKAKTGTQIAAIISTFVLISHADWGWFGKLFSWEVLGNTFVGHSTALLQWAATILTGLSGLTYFWGNRRLYLDDM